MFFLTISSAPLRKLAIGHLYEAKNQGSFRWRNRVLSVVQCNRSCGLQVAPLLSYCQFNASICIFISQLQVLFSILALFLLIFKIKSPILRFFIVNDVTLQQISEIKSKIV